MVLGRSLPSLFWRMERTYRSDCYRKLTRDYSLARFAGRAAWRTVLCCVPGERRFSGKGLSLRLRFGSRASGLVARKCLIAVSWICRTPEVPSHMARRQA